ncbi:hypothetical protein [Candidatus Binatus sp.]|uniref:hypothetical protein n=1 Tax=Candidatus Binatus sp. TaxID=2811406 RepID=UPI003BAFBE87
MTVEDALRKIALLRRVSTDKGALPAEREAAYRLQKVLMQRYAIKDQEIPDGQTTTRPFRLNWNYWQELLDEFGLSLNRFGGRGSVEIGNNIVAHIRLAANDWWIEVRTPREKQITVRDRGLDSLRVYLKEHAPKGYSFLRR